MHRNFIPTNHALEQFISRYDRNLTYEDAKLLLETGIDEKVVQIERRTSGGEYQWHLPTLDVVLITKLRKGMHVIVTVVAAGQIHDLHIQNYVDKLEELGHQETADKSLCLKITFDVVILGDLSTGVLNTRIVHRILRSIEGIAKDMKHNQIAELSDIYVGKWENE